MEAVIWIVFGIITVIVSCVRLALGNPEEANKPVFWVKSAVITVVAGLIGYIVALLRI